MEPRHGTYALILTACTDTLLQVGKLGPLQVTPGVYIYVGSAFGPGGVRARVAHHQRRTTHPHWHIDYLRRATQLVEVWYTYDPLRREHHWAEALQQMRGVSLPLPRFGASDCTCAAHLYLCQRRPSWQTLQNRLRRTGRAPLPLYCQQLAPEASSLASGSINPEPQIA